MVRTAGAYAQVMAHDNGYTTLKLPSGEVRMVVDHCMATIGQVGNRSFEQIVSGKAGRSRWLGKRPKVRGVVMNPVDHPHGGGEGKHQAVDIQSLFGENPRKDIRQGRRINDQIV